MSNNYHEIYLHCITATKGRKAWIDLEMDDPLGKFINGVCKNHNCLLLAFGASDDHIHLLIELGVQNSSSHLMKQIKQSTSRWIKQEFPEKSDFQWQKGYAAFSEDRSTLDRVKKYVLNQRDHHKSVSSGVEYEEILTEHGMELDKRDPI